MIKTYLFTHNETQQDVPLEDWQSLAQGDHKLLWVDVRAYSSDDIEELARLFGLHPLAVESCLDEFRRPHLYEFSDHLYVNLTTVSQKGRSVHGLKPSELHLFAGERFVITAVKEEASDAVDNALKEYLAAPSLSERGTIYAVYLLAEDLVETYFPIVEQLDDEADHLEDEMLERADRRSLRKLTNLKRRGFDLRKLLGPQRDVFNELARRDFHFMHGEEKVFFQDVYNRMIRLFDMMDTVREILSGNLDIYLSTVSNRLNEVVKVLTVAATVLMTLALITGFYGMNLNNMPWADHPNGVWYITLIMAGIAAGMLWLFRKIDWL